jgi:hypothetical protein
MTMLQLNPMIPVWVEGKGEGYAFLVTDYSQEHHKIWSVVCSKTGEIWGVPNPQIRFQWNYSLGRIKYVS